VESVSKRFRRYGKNQTYTLQEMFLRGWRARGAHDDFVALDGVSLHVAAGEMVGVIGRNGAGKSSLLRLVGGIGEPNSGRIAVEGRLGALIDLGAGYHPELTGRENVYMNGVISGLRRRQVNAILDEIVAFAELQDFIDSPVRTYSSGMQLRLAFAVAVHVQPQVLLVDEVLAVGDLGFQRKCLERIEALKSQGAAILFVTHDLTLAEQVCTRIAWLNRGHVAAWGPAGEVVDAYRRSMDGAGVPVTDAESAGRGAEVLRINVNRFGTQEIELHDVQLNDDSGTTVVTLPQGRALTVCACWRATQMLRGLIFSVSIHGADGTLLSEAYRSLSKLPTLYGQIALRFARLDLAPGAYYVDVGVYADDWSLTYDYHWHVYTLIVSGGDDGKGPLRPPSEWNVTPLADSGEPSAK
jgi:lipopolysaccharide transport system ATP-binding protein